MTLLSCTVTTASAVDAGTLPTAAEILAHVATAAGVEPKNYVREATITRPRLSGHEIRYRIGDDFREVDTAGPFITQQGHLEDGDWHANANGEIILDQPDPGQAAKEKTIVTVSSSVNPAGYVIADLNAAGHGTRRYIDASTWRVVRKETVGLTQTRTVVYDDFRTVAGYTSPWHSTYRDGHTENDTDLQITRFEPNAATAADLKRVPARLAFFIMPPGKSSVPVPVHFEGGRFYVRLKIGDRGLDFLLDSGAAGITIDEGVAKSLGLRIYDTWSSAENAGRVTSSRVVVPKATVGEIELRDVVMSTLPDLGDENPGTFKAVGLLGFDFLGAAVFELNYERGTLTAIDPDGFVPPKDRRTIVADVRLASQVPMTDVLINGSLGERFFFDTGAEVPFIINDYFVRRYPDAAVDRARRRFDPVQFYGVGGEFSTRPVELSAVRIGNTKFEDFLAYVVDDKRSYSGDDDGVIGSDILRLFTVDLDYADSRVYLTPTNAAHVK